MKLRIILILVISVFAIKNGFAYDSVTDSLRKIVKSSLSHDSSRAKALIALAWEIKYEDNILAKKYCSEGLTLAKKLGRNKDIADGLKLSGILADEAGDSKSSIDFYLQAISFYKKLKDSLSIAKSEYNIGMLYLQLEQVDEAKKYFKNSLKVFEQKKFLPGIGLVIQNLGICHYNSQNYDSALYYFEKAKIFGESNGLTDYNIIGNLGNCYYKKGDLKNAKKYLTQCCNMFEAAGDTSSSLYNYKKNLADIYGETGDLNTALMLYEQCKSAYIRLGIYYSEQNANVLISMAYNYKQMGNFGEAYNNASIAYKIKDSIFRTDFASAMSEMKEKYDAEKNELSISNLNKEAKLKDDEIKNQTKQMIGLGIGLLVLLTFIFVLYKNIVNKKRANAIIKMQKAIVDEKNREIIDSISYAKRLQNAILPPENLIYKYLPNSFLIYKPKDIVAGDFYWFDVVDDEIFIAAADSTGHGVPGAIVSVVCSNALHRTLNEFKIRETGKLLDKTRDLVLETFSKSEERVKDGMDISLVSIKQDKNSDEFQISWSGANNPLIYIKGGELSILKAHKQAIGETENPSPFPTNSLSLKSGDSLYLITDGYSDQFGGPKAKKFKTNSLAQLLHSNHTKPIVEFKEIVENTFEDWKGNLEQIDDVCIIAIRL